MIEPESIAAAQARDSLMSDRPPLVVLNPASRRGRHVRAAIQRALRGGRGELVVTDGPEAAQRLAAEAARDGRNLVAVGGDGTVSAMANGILESGRRVALGIVPAGNGNDYAYRAVGIPAALPHAIAIALTGAPRPMDAGLVNGRCFVNGLGVGIDANIAAAATRLKRVPMLRGQMLYWAASLSELMLHYDRCPSLLVTCDSQTDDRRHYALAAVSLGPTYGGGFRINPGADPRDGIFDVCLIWKPGLARALHLLPMIERGEHLGQPEVRRLRARQVQLEALQPIYAHLDGEVLRAERFDARVLPGALLVRQP